MTWRRAFWVILAAWLLGLMVGLLAGRLVVA